MKTFDKTLKLMVMALTLVFSFSIFISCGDSDGGKDDDDALYYAWFTNNGGSSGNNFKIGTPKELLGFAKIVNGTWGGSPSQFDFSGKIINLKANLDLENREWEPIGFFSFTDPLPFSGEFDGNGKKITGLKVNKPSIDCVGLFGYVVNGTIKSLEVSGSVLGKENVGGVLGCNSSGTVENCSYTGDVTGTSNVGGVAGRNTGGSVLNCYNKGDVTGTGGNVGGVVGENYSGGAVSNCYNTGNVKSTGVYHVGGVVGRIFGCTVENCYNTGNVEGNSFVGGVAGRMDGSSLENCVSLGQTVTGNLIGRVVVVGSSPIVNNNYAQNSMIPIGASFSGDSDYDGTFVTLAETQNQNWWETIALFEFPSPWKWDSVNKRPKLYWE